MSPDERIQIRVTHRYSASAERVFDAWLDTDKARHFFFATAQGEMVRAELDPRVGGTFCFVDRRAGVDVVHKGEYLEIDRPRRLVFTFSADESEATTVEIEIEPLDDGCELTLSHEMAPAWAAYADRTRHGWTTILERLAKRLGEASEETETGA